VHKVVAAAESQRGWLACPPVQRRDIAHDETAGRPKDMTVIADIDAGRPAADTAPPRRISARSSMQQTTDARTHLTQDAASTLHVPLREEGVDAVAERASDEPDRKTRLPTATGIAGRSLAVGQVLDSKESERNERNERKNAG
jgi:hypothetical protein